ncbi:S-methyl-5'-thioadenosine phosphorylase [bacterium]|nr:S-methyl-5'-thioadenosine phosphorylase [bacterium]
MTVLGVIGGSGVYSIKGATVAREHAIETAFGAPSDKVFELRVAVRDAGPDAVNGAHGSRFFFLPRHGLGHRLLPSEINYRANILAMKQLGVTHLLAVSAVGILADGIHPGDLVVPDQIFDRTKGVRPSTFFGGGIVGHVSFGKPFCGVLSRQVAMSAKAHGTTRSGGTYVCMEGPQFSTRAESLFYREQLSASVIGMTALPEAKLAREAGLHYAMLALATDYDCWNEHEGEVSADAVVAVVRANVAKANNVILDLASALNQTPDQTCGCATAASRAVMTDPSRIPPEALTRLASILNQ